MATQHITIPTLTHGISLRDPAESSASQVHTCERSACGRHCIHMDVLWCLFWTLDRRDSFFSRSKLLTGALVSLIMFGLFEDPRTDRAFSQNHNAANRRKDGRWFIERVGETSYVSGILSPGVGPILSLDFVFIHIESLGHWDSSDFFLCNE